jgi:hypothetical protein
LQINEPIIPSLPVVPRIKTPGRGRPRVWGVQKVGSMNIARKVCITLAVTAVSLGLIGVAAPAEARDSSWGCGGACFVGPDEPAETDG